MRLISIAAGVSVAVLALTGCTGGESPGGADSSTFTMGLSADPGNLDPQASAASGLLQATLLAYDSLLSIDSSGTISSQLATDWSLDGATVNLTLGENITCSDGAPFTAEDAAANLAWVGNPENQSPMLGVFLPAGAVATAVSETELTIELGAPSPFVLNGLAMLPMVCGNAIDDRSVLAAETHGTGPFVLTEAAQGDQYVYELRADYEWGPGGLSSATDGLPEKVVIRVVSNETTAANLLLSGELNAAAIIGSDSGRLDAAGLFRSETPVIAGQMWFNHSADRLMGDKTLRLALTHSLDLEQIEKVTTSDKGEPGTTFAVSDPVACVGDSVSGALPEFDVDAAAALLDDAGWKAGADGVRTKNGEPLTVTFIQDASMGAGGAAAAELAVQAWTALGVQVTSRVQEETVMIETVFGTGDWDVAWLPLNISSPDQLVPFASGPAPADGGSNFAQVDNADYIAGVEGAANLPGADGCDEWLDAESTLVRDANIIPFANQLGLTYGSGAEFTTNGQIVPLSIRMASE